MNKSRAGLLAGIAALTLLTACNGKDKAPSGQVVATVNGTDITVHELNSELQQLRAPASAPRKQVESVALARVIERKMLADQARKRNLDKNPQFILAERRADEALLIQALQSDIAQKVPATTREAAQKFITENPGLFAQRKILTIDQIQFLRPANIASLPLGPAKTMADVQKVLTDAQIQYRRAPVQLDALTVSPALTAEIEKIRARNAEEVFMFANQPEGAPAPIMYVNHVTGERIEPFVGEKAIAFAQQVIQRAEVQKRLVTQLKGFQAEAKGNIKYAAGYGPPEAAKPVPLTGKAGAPVTAPASAAPAKPAA